MYSPHRQQGKSRAGDPIYTHNGGADDLGSAKYNQVNLGAIYSLSKRTTLYAICFYETALRVVSTRKAVADLNDSAYPASNRQLAGTFGITTVLGDERPL